MKPAPFYDDLADGPPGGAAHWVHADDGARLRVAHWRAGSAGTVLLFPGRTEYCEKYGRAAADLGARGFATITIDWRGQGLADHSGRRWCVGDVVEFADYQRDVAAMVAHAAQLDLPRPFYLIAHSMGGCIGLRALLERLDVAAAVFSAPMWGIRFPAPMRPLAGPLSAAGMALGLGGWTMLGASTKCYSDITPFDDNTLTHDRDMLAYMQAQTHAVPELGLGGPSFRWLSDALREMAALMAAPAPETPAAVFLGEDEAIVADDAIRERVANWPGAVLREVAGARHELMMELPAIRQGFFDQSAALFAAHAGTHDGATGPD